MGQTGTKVASKLANSFTFSGSPSEDMTAERASQAELDTWLNYDILRVDETNIDVTKYMTLMRRTLFFDPTFISLTSCITQ